MLKRRDHRPKPSLNYWLRAARIICGLCLFWVVSMTVGADIASAETQSDKPPYTTVDFVPQRQQLGQRLYLKNCATCHIAVPPQVLPSETWRNLIQDQSHYGADLDPLQEPSRSLIWGYLRYASRQKSNREERTPYRVGKSQYFRALHPRVELPRPTALNTCASCHPAAPNFNFRQLSPEWFTAP